MSYANVEMKIVQWSEARRIIQNSTAEAQLLKAVSEMGELADATIKHNEDGIIDAVGDVMVCLVNYCAIKDIELGFVHGCCIRPDQRTARARYCQMGYSSKNEMPSTMRGLV
jgi:NTP pyrophosphatase (non-canonical NTP hydrolase)